MKKEEEISRSLVINFRGDIKAVAALVAFYDRLGFPPKSKSAIIRMTVSDFADLLIQQGKVEAFRTFSEAYSFLSQRNLIDDRKGRIGRMKEMAQESITLDAVELERDERLLPDNIMEIAADPETLKRGEELHETTREEEGGDTNDS